MNLPHPWGEYARLQHQSRRKTSVDSMSWGIEEEMDLFLEDPTDYTPAKARRLEVVRLNAARRERYRAGLRKIHGTMLESPSIDPIAQLEAREALNIIESRVTSDQWALMVAVAHGYDYADAGLEKAASAGAARAQMCRLRRQFSGLYLSLAA